LRVSSAKERRVGHIKRSLTGYLTAELELLLVKLVGIIQQLNGYLNAMTRRASLFWSDLVFTCHSLSVTIFSYIQDVHIGGDL